MFEKNVIMAKITIGFQVLPYVTEERLYLVVSEIIEYIASCGIKYEVGATETVMEGELDELLDIVKKSLELCTEQGAR